MNQFYQKEIGGVLGAVLVAASTPVLADDYRYGYSSSNVCYRTEYREEYVAASPPPRYQGTTCIAAPHLGPI